jgi:hypothetical protein
VIVSYREGAVFLEGAVPALGYEVEVRHAGPEEVRVRFESDRTEIEVRVRWEDGRLDIEVDQD